MRKSTEAKAATKQTPRKVKHPYVTHKKGTCGGKPIIAGTRIKVSHIVTCYERMGQTPDEILQSLPHVTLAQFHDALSCYYDNPEEINRQIADERRLVEELRLQHKPRLVPKQRR